MGQKKRASQYFTRVSKSAIIWWKFRNFLEYERWKRHKSLRSKQNGTQPEVADLENDEAWEHRSPEQMREKAAQLDHEAEQLEVLGLRTTCQNCQILSKWWQMLPSIRLYRRRCLQLNTASFSNTKSFTTGWIFENWENFAWFCELVWIFRMFGFYQNR